MNLSLNSVIKKLLLLFLIILGLVYAKVFLMPLTIGGILATLFLPFCRWLEAKNLPKGIAVFACFLALFLIISILVFLLGWKISDLANDVSLLK